MDQLKAGATPHPTLIVCPPTLVSHWAHEIGKFVEEGFLQPLQYQGSPKERAQLQSLLSQHNVVVASYESVKADVDWLAQHSWLYCVLDEGHIIRNPKSKITQVPRYNSLPSCQGLRCVSWVTSCGQPAGEGWLSSLAAVSPVFSLTQLAGCCANWSSSHSRPYLALKVCK